MQRATLEFDIHEIWRQIFGSSSSKVHVIEALRCFKCDAQGLAIICKIKLKSGNMAISDFVGKGLLTYAEILYKERGGSMVIYIEGRPAIPPLPKNVRMAKVLMPGPPEFLDVDRVKVEVVGKKKEIQEFLRYADRLKMSYKILGLTSLDARPKSLLSALTSKQRRALLTAYALGYYDVPRRVSSEELSQHLNADKSTTVEHLRKAERKIIAGIIAE